jgi:hypothetical protein
VSPTCGSVVEVLVDKLAGTGVSNCIIGSSVDAQTYVVGGLGDVAERRRRELGDDLLDLDVLRHDGGVVRERERGVGCGGCVADGSKVLQIKAGQTASSTALARLSRSLDHTADNVHLVCPAYYPGEHHA